MSSSKSPNNSNDPGMIKKGIYFPNLDGWRFVAFLAVFYHHSFYTPFPEISESSTYKLLKSTTSNGELGVDFFFVLSGFLIIYLLIREKQATGKIDAKSFYIRRVLRIFPLYYLCLFFGFWIFPIFKQAFGGTTVETADPLKYSVFLGNLDIVGQRAMPDSGVLGILWSVSIEEQFYFVIPIILLVTPLRWFPVVFLVVIMASLILRAFHIEDYYYIKFHTFASMGNLAVGGLAAFYSATKPRFIKFVENLNPIWILACYLCLIAFLTFRSTIFATPAMKTAEALCLSAMFAFVILEQNYARHSFFKMANNRIFTWLGKYTYGLYCLHLLAALIVITTVAKLGINTNLWQVVFIQTPLMLIVTIALAYISYELYEKRFLRLKERFSVLRKRRSSSEGAF